MRSMHGAAQRRLRRQAGLLPTIPWSIAAAAFTLAALVLLLYGIAFAAAALAPYADAANVERITLERGACYGICPAYRLTLGADGRATYEGHAFVRELGTFEARFAPRAFRQFAHALAQRGMLASRQNVTIIDAPQTTVAVTFRDGSVARTDVWSGLGNADDVADDMFVGGLIIDGFAGHICGWQRVERESPTGSPGSYSPISTAPCRHIGQR